MKVSRIAPSLDEVHNSGSKPGGERHIAAVMRTLALLCMLMPWMASFCAAAPSGPTIRFLAERAPVDLGEVQMAAGNQLSIPFTLDPRHLSAPLEAPARALTLRLKAKAVTLAAITLPEIGSSFIVLLIPNPKGGYLPIVMRADDPKFRPGDIYFYNHTANTVFGHVGTAKFMLASGKGQMLRPTGAREATFYNVGLGVRLTTGDQLLTNTRWPLLTRRRSYVFFYHDPLRDRVDFHAVDEFVPPPKASTP